MKNTFFSVDIADNPGGYVLNLLVNAWPSGKWNSGENQYQAINYKPP